MQKRLFSSILTLLLFVFGSGTMGLLAQQINLSRPERIATNFLFTEGPVWINGQGLLFSDIEGDQVYRWDSVRNTADSYISPSSRSNGLALDRQGNLLLAQHSARAVSRRVNGQLVPVVTTYRGLRLNSPNDLIVKSDGSIFFTDPPYGIPRGQQQEQRWNGIYRISPRGNLQMLDSSFNRPNGLALSPDEKLLYVNENQGNIMYVLDVVRDSVLTNKREFYRFPSGTGSADGLKVDPAGNVYSTGPRGVYIISPRRTLLDTITVAETTTNVAFGGANRTTLYITAGKSVYRVRNAVVTANSTSVAERIHNPLSAVFFDATAQTLSATITSHGSGAVSIKIYSLHGACVAGVYDGILAQGEYLIQWQNQTLPSGFYLLHVDVGGENHVRKILIEK